MSEAGVADAKLYVFAVPHSIHPGAEVSTID
jgi:hypothetical protein